MNTSTPTLPHESDAVFLTDGGLETEMIFREGLELPSFASIVLLDDEAGIATLTRYYEKYLSIARRAGCGFILESATWRASEEWANALGYDSARLDTLNQRAVGLVRRLAADARPFGGALVISGCIGPRGDGYVVDARMTREEARAYHGVQATSLAAGGAQMITGATMTYVEEAIGICDAATDVGLPAVVSFTTETDGKLPSGRCLADAIAHVDSKALTPPAYYMINCAHPDHFSDALEPAHGWTQRIRGMRANASRRSHAELDDADALDDGDPAEFGQLHRALRDALPHLNVFGGCCGTDHRHVAAVGDACVVV